MFMPKNFSEIFFLTLIGITAIGCGSLFKGPRNSYTFSFTVINESDYDLTASIGYDDRSVEDECSKSGDANYIDIAPGETQSVSISTMCHQEPSSSATVKYPENANLDSRYYSFSANKKISCTKSGCKVEQTNKHVDSLSRHASETGYDQFVGAKVVEAGSKLKRKKIGLR